MTAKPTAANDTSAHSFVRLKLSGTAFVPQIGALEALIQGGIKMRYILIVTAAIACGTPVLAAHDLGTPPGKAAAVGIDRNRDGNTNGKDYAPGQSAAEAAAVDNNGDGKINGQDYAPGQIPSDHHE